MAKKPAPKQAVNRQPSTVSTHVRDIPIDGVDGVYFHSGTVRMNLYVNSFDPPSGAQGRTVTHRVAMPLLDFVAFAETLNRIKTEIARVSAEQSEAAATKDQAPPQRVN